MKSKFLLQELLKYLDNNQRYRNSTHEKPVAQRLIKKNPEEVLLGNVPQN